MGFDVFDGFGNFVGKFVPEGGGLGGLLIGIILLIVIGIAYFAITLIGKLIAAGFSAFQRGEWLLGILGTSPIWIVLVMIAFSVITTAKRSADVESAKNHILVQNVKPVSCEGGGGSGWISFDLVNTWNKPVTIYGGGTIDDVCTVANYYRNLNNHPVTLLPGQAVNIQDVESFAKDCDIGGDAGDRNWFKICVP